MWLAKPWVRFQVHRRCIRGPENKRTRFIFDVDLNTDRRFRYQDSVFDHHMDFLIDIDFARRGVRAITRDRNRSQSQFSRTRGRIVVIPLPLPVPGPHLGKVLLDDAFGYIVRYQPTVS